RAAAAARVGEQPVVQLVRRGDAQALELARKPLAAGDARGEMCPLAVHGDHLRPSVAQRYRLRLPAGAPSTCTTGSLARVCALQLAFVHYPGRLARLESARSGAGPTEFLFGAVELERAGHAVDHYEVDPRAVSGRIGSRVIDRLTGRGHLPPHV